MLRGTAQTRGESHPVLIYRRCRPAANCFLSFRCEQLYHRCRPAASGFLSFRCEQQQKITHTRLLLTAHPAVSRGRARTRRSSARRTYKTDVVPCCAAPKHREHFSLENLGGYCSHRKLNVQSDIYSRSKLFFNSNFKLHKYLLQIVRAQDPAKLGFRRARRVSCGVCGDGDNICARRRWGAKEVRSRARQGRWRVLRRLLSARQPPAAFVRLSFQLADPCNLLGVTAV
jgi:hypothetical protein